MNINEYLTTLDIKEARKQGILLYHLFDTYARGCITEETFLSYYLEGKLDYLIRLNERLFYDKQNDKAGKEA